MKYKKYKKPIVKYAKPSKNTLEHPQIVLGETANGNYVSVSITHSKNVKGHHVHQMHRNIERAYMVDDTVYTGSKSAYRGSVPRNRIYKIHKIDAHRARLISRKGRVSIIK